MEDIEPYKGYVGAVLGYPSKGYDLRRVTQESVTNPIHKLGAHKELQESYRNGKYQGSRSSIGRHMVVSVSTARATYHILL